MQAKEYHRDPVVPEGKIDVILDTDAYNEIDDQFAISYLLSERERLNVVGICAAPFLNALSVSPEDGMRKSYDEIKKLLGLAGREELCDRVFLGSDAWLPDEKTPRESEAARRMAEAATRYTAEQPLYIVALGAITNVASALLMNPAMAESTVIVWLGGHGHHMPHTAEFNMRQDVAAARVVIGSAVPLVQLPCAGVVDHLLTTKYELEHWLLGKTPLCDYLAQNTIAAAESYAAGKPWSRVIWDVSAIAWLLDREGRLMKSDLRCARLPGYDNVYEPPLQGRTIRYVSSVNRDAIFEDLFRRLVNM